MKIFMSPKKKFMRLLYNVRLLLVGLFVSAGFFSSAQIQVPEGFTLIKGESPVGRDDYFQKGMYRISEDIPFQADTPPTDEGKINMLTGVYGVPFKKTRDGLYYGTGLSRGRYKYIVVYRFAFILSASQNDALFSDYSLWLLNMVRGAIHDKTELYFKKN
jgi:hypothetical protein